MAHAQHLRQQHPHPHLSHPHHSQAGRRPHMANGGSHPHSSPHPRPHHPPSHHYTHHRPPSYQPRSSEELLQYQNFDGHPPMATVENFMLLQGDITALHPRDSGSQEPAAGVDLGQSFLSRADQDSDSPCDRADQDSDSPCGEQLK